MKNQEAAKLVIRFQQNEEGAFESLYQQLWPVVYGIARRQTRTPEDARDAAQEVFTVIFEKAHTVRNPFAFNSWIYHRIQNACRRYHREYSRFCPLDSELWEDNAAYLPEEHLEQQEGLLDLLDSLPQPYREVVEMRYIEGIAPRQMCQRTHREVGEMHSLIAQSADMLRDLYRETWGGAA